MPSYSDWNELDPQWAWDKWQPSEDIPWDYSTASHLLRRATLGQTPKQLDQAIANSPDETIKHLFESGNTSEYETTASALGKSIVAGGNLRQLSVGWLHRMVNTPQPLLEKMTLFWHGHFATGADKVNDIHAMYQQNMTLRQLALGSFSEMAHTISKDPAMLLYLDSAYNRKAHPNENYARELMELFCMGEGNYSERDVQELARCFTGWEVRRLQFRFNRFQHDPGTKELLGITNIESGEGAIDVVLNHEATPRFIVSKLFRFFIADEPQPSPELLEPLARQFREDNLKIAPVLQRILSSNLMFSQLTRTRKIRSPLEWMLGWMQALQITGNLQLVSEGLTQMGQSLYFPPNVKGWEGGRSWINSSTLVARANALHKLMHDGNTRFGKTSLLEYAKSIQVAEPIRWIEHLQRYFLAIYPSDAQRDLLLQEVKSYPLERQLREIVCRMATWPQTHLS